MAVRVPGVVQYLHLGPAPVDLRVLLGGPIEDPRVPPRGDLPVEPELEVLELIDGHQVGAVTVVMDGPVQHVPAEGVGALEVAPTFQRGPVEKEPESFALFCGGECVGDHPLGSEWRGDVAGRAGGKGEGHEEGHGHPGHRALCREMRRE